MVSERYFLFIIHASLFFCREEKCVSYLAQILKKFRIEGEPRRTMKIDFSAAKIKFSNFQKVKTFLRVQLSDTLQL